MIYKACKDRRVGRSPGEVCLANQYSATREPMRLHSPLHTSGIFALSPARPLRGDWIGMGYEENMWIFDCYYKGCVELWSRDIGSSGFKDSINPSATSLK